MTDRRRITAGLTWRTNTADASSSHGNLFDPVKVDAGKVFIELG